jgi:3-deoxy-manno-octulosonate cytidylyltransferase (CMP-KDO synthetase)
MAEKPRTIGVVPARMAASRFPGKPLHPILGRPLLEHCFERAKLYEGWDTLVLATCDEEIKAFGEAKGYPVVMTSASHTRALDRVAEAAECLEAGADDLIVCVQGDEPLLGPDMIEAVLGPLIEDNAVDGTMLAVPIRDEETYLNTDIVKIVHDMKGDVLYTSRSPIPHCKTFSEDVGALRVGGIFGFRWHFLEWFTETPESPLEIAESCDSNRICDHGNRQRISPVPYRPYISVDSPEDIDRVEAVMEDDALWGRY